MRRTWYQWHRPSQPREVLFVTFADCQDFIMIAATGWSSARHHCCILLNGNSVRGTWEDVRGIASRNWVKYCSSLSLDSRCYMASVTCMKHFDNSFIMRLKVKEALLKSMLSATKASSGGLTSWSLSLISRRRPHDGPKTARSPQERLKLQSWASRSLSDAFTCHWDPSMMPT